SSIRGEDGQSFESRLILSAEGGKLTGKFSRGEDRWLEIQNPEVNGNELSWIVKRERPDGSIATYRMKGAVQDGVIKGVAKAQLDGQERSVEWIARRK